MYLTLDNLAHRYKCLPSEALDRATTLDLYVLDLSAKWSNHQQEVADGKQSNVPSETPSLDEMKAMIARVKGRK